jgi:hypothetical protein
MVFDDCAPRGRGLEALMSFVAEGVIFLSGLSLSR